MINAEVEKSKPKFPNPFVEHREIFFQGYSTAERLCQLVMHLWNSSYELDLSRFLANADADHVKIAIECMQWYAHYRENDRDFMALANELRDNFYTKD